MPDQAGSDQAPYPGRPRLRLGSHGRLPRARTSSAIQVGCSLIDGRRARSCLQVASGPDRSTRSFRKARLHRWAIARVTRRGRRGRRRRRQVEPAGVPSSPHEDVPVLLLSTDLSRRLVSHRVDTVLVSGVTTSGCVRANVVNSCSPGFRTTVVREAVRIGHVIPASLVQ